MSIPKFEWPEQSRIVFFEKTATLFFQDIVGMDYSAWRLVTENESMLWDFACCAASCPDFPLDLRDFKKPREARHRVWITWVRQKILDRYSVEIGETDMIYLVDLFQQIETHKNAKVQ